MKLHEMKQKRNTIATDMRALHDKIGDTTWTEEQRTQWNAAKSELDALDERIAREEELRRHDQSFVDEQEPEQRQRQESPEMQAEVRRAAAFDRLLRHGLGELTAEERQAVKELRAQGTTPDDKGGYTVPTQMRNTIIDAMKAYGGIVSVAQILNTSNGQDITWSTSDGTAEEGELLAENAAATEGDVTFGTAILGAKKLSSKIIRVSNELLQDSGVDIEAYLAGRIAQRIGRGEAKYLVQGIGTTWTSNQLQAGHTYYWYIRTINAFGASAFVEVPALCSMDTGELMDLIDDGIQKSDAFQNVKDGVDTNLEGIMENSLANHGTVEHQYQQYGEVRADILVVKTTVATAEKGLADLSTYVQAQIGPEGSLTSAVNQKMTAEVNSDGTAKASYTLNMGIVRNGVKYNTGFGMSIEPSGNSYKSTVVFAADQFGIYSGNNPGNWQAAFFVYNGQVFIRSALIQEASIDFAKITDSLQSANFIPGGGGRGWSLPKSGSPEFHGKLYADSGEFAFNGVNNVTRIDGNGITVNLSGGGRVVVGRWT
ncbi:phage major capsid protein [Salmonella enterica subsp. enterica serovar Newport]|nr:phage major capsid protein [Salmonella enterica]ECO1014838.1 phage major capsid protein [Salmonella enterica subsp. enterica serovar Newport]EFO5285961.1 phage major capsid protein [Salmonella enterica]